MPMFSGIAENNFANAVRGGGVERGHVSSENEGVNGLAVAPADRIRFVTAKPADCAAFHGQRAISVRPYGYTSVLFR